MLATWEALLRNRKGREKQQPGCRGCHDRQALFYFINTFIKSDGGFIYADLMEYFPVFWFVYDIFFQQ